MKHNIQELISQGYRRTSRAFGIVSRIDRKDWVEVLARRFMCNVADMDLTTGSDQDFYRRVCSKDKLQLDPKLALKIPPSSHDPIGYIPKDLK